MANEIHRLFRELEDQTRSRIKYQEEVRILKEQNRQLKQSLNKDAYVVVLVDGDGAKFSDSLLRRPHTGAAEAAQKLIRHVRDFLKDTALSTDEVPILARIFANVKGLAKSLHSSGIIDSEDDMYIFAENFTNSRADFDFINVGHGKENADSKMRRMLRHFHRDYRCKKIFFAACHDSGYVHELRQYLDISETEERIVLVETTPAHSAFLKPLSFQMTRFGDVFSNKHLHNKCKLSITPQQSEAPAEPAGTPRMAQLKRRPTSEEGQTESENNSILARYSSNSSAFPVSNHHQKVVLLTKTPTQTKIIQFNKAGHRLDPPIQAPDASSAYSTYGLKCEKIRPRVLCNGFYINGRCGRRDTCGKEHEVDLSAQEIAIHRYKARTRMCKNGPGCIMFICCLSHHCPYLSCTRQDCKFKRTKFGDMHLEKESLEPGARWIEGTQNGQSLVPVKRAAGITSDRNDLISRKRSCGRRRGGL